MSRYDATTRETEKPRLRQYLTLLTTHPLNAYAERYVELIDNILIAAEMVGDHAVALANAHLNIRHLERIGYERLGREAQQVAIRSLSKGQREMYERAAGFVRRARSDKVDTRRANPQGPPAPTPPGGHRWLV